jgi:hypothetical protein
MTLLTEFRPSRNGLHFDNSWPPGTPDYVFNIPILGEVHIGDASDGLCGGMAFTVADLYLAGRLPPARTDAPPGGTPLFRYIASRLLASFSIPSGVLTYYYWANTPDHDTGIWPVIRSGLARMTIQDQIPQVTAGIDRNQPATLGLVTVRSLNPGNLGRCHQVLAYGYDRAGSEITFRVYDPNQHDDDSVTISLDTGDPGHPTPIVSNVSSDPIRGFFHVDYSYTDPSAAAG